MNNRAVGVDNKQIGLCPEKGNQTMNASDLFPPSQYLGHEDIENAGGEMQLTIKAVSRKEFEENGKKRVKGSLTFSEVEKMLTLNSTNTHTLIAMYGEKDIDKAWVGKHVILYVDPNVPFEGKMVKGLRIRLVDAVQDAIQAYWKKSREMGYQQQDGLKLLAKHNNDFAAALKELEEMPF